MFKRLIIGAAALCALATASAGFGQVVQAPAGTYIPAQGTCYGAKGDVATCVDATHLLPAGKPDVRSTGTLNAATSNATYAIAIGGGGSAAFTVSGLAASGGTLTLEASNDGGTTWSIAKNIDAASAFTADGQFRVNAGGRTHLRLRVSSTGTGTVAIASNVSAAATDVDPSNAAFQGAAAMTIGTTYAVQRSVGANCTVSGNLALTLADGSVIVLPVTGFAGGGWQTFPFAVAAVNSSGTTATCSYYNLK